MIYPSSPLYPYFFSLFPLLSAHRKDRPSRAAILKIPSLLFLLLMFALHPLLDS